MFSVHVDYPSLDEEKKILLGTSRDDNVELTKVLSAKAIVNLQKLIRSVPVGEYVIDYVARLVRATRPDAQAPEFVRRMVDFGAGPRAGQFLVRAGQAFAAMDGRFSVAIDDIKKAAIPVLRHRVTPTSRPRPRARRARTSSSSCSPSSASPTSASTRRSAVTAGQVAWDV